MPIVIPGKRYSPRLARSRLFAHGMAGKKAVTADLLVTPLVDMFVIIVIFLLQNFSATGEILVVSKDITLPSAANGKEVERFPVVQISAELQCNGQPAPEDSPCQCKDAGSETVITKSILVEGKQVAQVSEIERDEYWNIPALEEELRDIKKRDEAVHGQDGFKGEVNIQAHCGVPFSTVKRVLFSCNQSGFTQINFAVLKGGGAPSPAAD